MKFKVGDIVRLKSGSQAMTVRGEDPNFPGQVECNWYLEGKIQARSFYDDQLELSEKDEF